jgi:hypothetical protein
VVVVGDKEMYSSYTDFTTYCSKIKTTECVNSDSSYSVRLVSLNPPVPSEGPTAAPSTQEEEKREECEEEGSGEKEKEEVQDDDDEAEDDLRAQWREHRAGSMCLERVVMEVTVKAP